MTSSPARVLIATADHALARAYADRLGTSHFNVQQAANDKEVLADALSFKPDILLLDTDLNTESHDVLHILKQTPETKHTKVILLTGLIDPALRTRARELGAVDIIIKSPATIPDVIKRVHFHLEQHPRPSTIR